MFASQEPYHANAVVTLAAAVPTEWKRHRRLFHAAMKPLFRRSWTVPHSGWRFPYFGAAANLPLTVGLRITRGVRALVTGKVRARQQPWPKWRIVARSAAADRPAASSTPTRPCARSSPTRRPTRCIASIRGEWHPLRQLILVQLGYLTRVAEEG